MNPKRALRRLRDDDRWVGLTPSAPVRRRSVPREAVVTAVVLVLVVAASIGLVRLAADRVAAPTPAASPSSIRCGQAVPERAFHERHAEELPHDRGDAALEITNYAAAASTGDATTVSAVVSGGVEHQGRTVRQPYRGALVIGLVRSGRVVATASGAESAGTVGYDETGRVAATFRPRDCATGRTLPDGRYGILAGGVTMTLARHALHPTFAARWVRLSRGLIVGGTETVADGPWRGTGVPECGAHVDLRRLEAFVAASRRRMADSGIGLAVTGSVPHANAQGWSFQATVTNRGSRGTVTMRQIAATTVIAGGVIVAAPPSGATLEQSYFTSAAPGRSTPLSSDAPTGGCDPSADFTSYGPALPDVVHTAYVEFGVTSTGVPLVEIVHYREHAWRPPEIVG